jgi:RNA 2',3'-cyclic 3'-phosphodiesterase
VKQTLRVFVAIELDPDFCSSAMKLVEILSMAGADVKWVEPDNMHVTLKFLGDVSLTDTARICDAVKKAADEYQPFDIEFAGAGAFPNLGRPRTIWLGTREGSEPMRQLVESLESRLQKLGFRRENRPFQAHLTLGRVRRGGPEIAELGRLIAENAEFPAGASGVSEVIVFSSDLTSAGPVYSVVGRAKLGRR